MIKGVVFDYGGVLTQPQDPAYFDTLKQRFGWDKETLLASWKLFRSPFDADLCSPEEMYRRIALIYFNRTLTPEEATFCKQVDFDSWAHPNDETIAWIKELKAKGYKIGILTNMPTAFIPWFQRCAGEARALADAEVISGEERIVKPDARIYKLMADRLRLPPQELLFFDDTLANVDAAQACGFHATHFTTTANARTHLSSQMKR